MAKRRKRKPLSPAARRRRVQLLMMSQSHRVPPTVTLPRLQFMREDVTLA